MSKVVTFALILTLVLTACSSKVASSGQTAGSSALAQGGSNTLPGVTLLTVGTFKLEDTANAVTARQATELLPLWKAYRSLSGDSASATAELEALVKQIEQTMTAEQLRAITDMNLTSQDLMTTMQGLGLSMPEQMSAPSGSGQAGEGQQSPIGDVGAMPAGGGGAPPAGGGGAPPAGGGGPSGGGMPGGGNTALNPALRQTRQAQRNSAGGGSSPLLDALIKLLESKRA